MPLSKSRIIAGRQCPKLMWWKVHEPDAPELVPDAAQSAIFAQGNRVGELACQYVSGGTAIAFQRGRLAQMVADTRAAIEAGASVIYEASFVAAGVFVSVDILEREADGWVLIEVKSSTKVKSVYLEDAACQVHVLRQAGLNIRRVELMHLNRKCVYPDLGR